MSYNEKNDKGGVRKGELTGYTARIEKAEKKAAKRRETVSYFDKFAKLIYKGFKNGVVGAVFTSYRSGKVKSTSFKGRRPLLTAARNSVSSAFSSGYSSAVSKLLAEKLLDVRVRVYGTFLLTFGVYALLFGLLDNFVLGTDRNVFEIIFGLIFAVSSLPLLFCDEALASALDSSSLGLALKNAAGIRGGGFSKGERAGKGRVSYGFIAGVAAGCLGYMVSPFRLVLFMLVLLLAWLIMAKPEFGMVALTFLLPFLTVPVSALLICVTAVSYFVKILRRKRVASFEALDASVFGVILTILLGGIVAASPSAMGEAALYALLMAVYFLTVNLMKTKAWLDRMTVAAVFGLSLTCVLYFTGRVGDMTVGGVSESFVSLLEGTLASKLVSGDKGVVSAVSVIAIPMAASFFMRPAFKVARGYSAMALLFLLLPVVFDSSVYSALAVCLSVLLLLLIYSRSSVYLVFAAALMIPVGSLLFPTLSSRTLAALSEGFAQFARTRADVWHSVTGSLSEFLFGGIGFGKESFGAVYPMLSGNTAGDALHSYNTYLQIWVETGVFGLIIFLVFAWLIISAAFTAFARIDKARKSSAIRTKGVCINIPESLTQFAAEEKKAGVRLSVSQYSVSRRMGIAAPFCSVFGMLFYGIFDYIWYDEKVFLLFWLAAGLSAAYCSYTVGEIEDIELSYDLREDSGHKCEADIS